MAFDNQSGLQPAWHSSPWTHAPWFRALIVGGGLLMATVAQRPVCANPKVTSGDNHVAAAERAVSKPNIVLFLIDDLGWRDLACYGSTLYETPHIDRLARDGMKFTAGYAACCVCSPTRAALLTGKYPARLHLTDIIQAVPPADAKLRTPDWTHYLRLEETTIAEALRPAGYATAHIGKWHLGGHAPYSANGDLREGDPQNQGFDVNIAGSDQGQPPDYFFPYKRKVTLPRGPNGEQQEVEFDIPRMPGGQPGDFLTERLTADAEHFIRQHHERPFFLFFSHFTVHTAMGARLQARPEQIDKYEQRLKERPDEPQRNAIYAAMIESLDESVGRILRLLEELKIDDRTVVIFTSDNGALQGTTSLAPLRGWKGTAYEGGHRVPLIFKWPDVIRPGSVTDVPASSVDLFPTILEMAGVTRGAENRIDGESLTPILRQTGGLRRDAVYWHYPHYGYATKPFGAVRRGDYKLIEYFENGDLELYNLREDITESKNLATAHPVVAREMHERLATWRRSVGAQMPERVSTDDGK